MSWNAIMECVCVSELMREAHHPNIVQLLDVVLTHPESTEWLRPRSWAELISLIKTHAHSIHLILEYVPGGDMRDYLRKKGRLSEKEARYWLRQLGALHTAHTHTQPHTHTEHAVSCVNVASPTRKVATKRSISARVGRSSCARRRAFKRFAAPAEHGALFLSLISLLGLLQC